MHKIKLIEPIKIDGASISESAFAKGGISEWLEMDIEEFVLWINSARELQKT